MRDEPWSEAIAVGSLAFVENVKNQLGVKAAHHDIIEDDGGYALRKPAEAYAGNFSGRIEAVRSENTVLCDESVDDARTSLGPTRHTHVLVPAQYDLSQIPMLTRLGYLVDIASNEDYCLPSPTKRGV